MSLMITYGLPLPRLTTAQLWQLDVRADSGTDLKRLDLPDEMRLEAAVLAGFSAGEHRVDIVMMTGETIRPIIQRKLEILDRMELVPGERLGLRIIIHSVGPTRTERWRLDTFLDFLRNRRELLKSNHFSAGQPGADSSASEREEYT